MYNYVEGISPWIVISQVFQLLSIYLRMDITVVGTLRSHRIGLPKELTEVKDRDDISVKYAFTEDGNIVLVSYAVKKKSGKRNILMLTTMHKSVKITCDSRKKPNVITL